MKEKTAAAPSVDADTLKENEIARKVLSTGVQPGGFRVEYRGGTAHVYGTVKSAEERQKVLDAARSIGGVSQVTDGMQVGTAGPGGLAGPSAAAGAATTGTARTHTVKSGDTLSEIAKTHYGNASDYKKIFEANRDVLSDPDKIKPGQVLKLP